MKKKIILISCFAAVSLTACQNNQKPQPSAEEIEKMIQEKVSEARKEARAEAQIEMEKEISKMKEEYEKKDSYANTNSDYGDASSQDLMKKAYESGFREGVSARNEYDYYMRNNEKELKNNYLCYASVICPQEASNREIYNEYKRGFNDGWKTKAGL